MSNSLRLFLVEDNEEVAFLMRLHLERAGHQVTLCRTGADAFMILGQNPYDLVLLDYYLPDMKGLELLQSLTREGIRTPVLMMTVDGSAKVAAQSLRAGAIDYLSKDTALTFLGELPKRVQEAVTLHRLQQSNQLLVAALESTRDGICITDVQGTIIHVNAALERITGYTREEMIGQHPRMFRSDAHGQEFYDELWRTILAKRSWQGEMLNRHKAGAVVDTSLTISPIVDSRGQLTNFFGIYRDITERKQLERQLLHAQKMQSVGTLAGGVAHEFNNLLAGIQGYAALGLREPGVSSQLKEFLQFIVDLSDRAANLTRQLLAFARKPALSRQPTNMTKLLSGTADLVRHSLCIDVNVTLPETDGQGAGLQALADANQLQQVLINLALNARDALTRPDPIVFSLRQVVLGDNLKAFPDNVPSGDYIVLEVSDRGKGMAQEVLEQACLPFFTTKEVGQGTGLGLPVASGIVHGHQGYITIDSQLGEGTCVRLYLPHLKEGAPARPTVSEGEDSLEPEKMPSRNILVVDDERPLLDVVRRTLEIAGHRITGVTTGTEALKVLSGTDNYDLVILDLMIKGEDSSATFKTIRQRWPHLAILLCTGLLQTDSAVPSFQGEQVQLLRKPFRMNQLWLAVKQALQAQPGK